MTRPKTITGDAAVISDTISSMVSSVQTWQAKPHRGLQPRSTTRRRGRSARRTHSHRGFESPTYEATSNTRDQQNRLVRFLQGTHESVYEYDGESHRVRIKELTSSVETKNETFVWCGHGVASRICQKRSASAVTRNFFDQGFEEGSSDYFYARDHLGSIREVIGSNGTTIASRVSYDPWGRITETGSGALTDFAFTGHHFDRPTGLSLPLYRAYDPLLGRWLSQDPLGLDAGPNLYGYVSNNPINEIDPDGRLSWPMVCLFLYAIVEELCLKAFPGRVGECRAVAKLAEEDCNRRPPNPPDDPPKPPPTKPPPQCN